MLNFKCSRDQVLESIVVYNTMFLLGILVAIFGPTFLDLSERVGVDSGDLTTIFAARGAGYVLGSFLGGLLFDRFPRRLVLLVCVLGASASLLITPFCTTYIHLFASTIIVGLFGGAIDAALNSRILDIWKDGSAPFMQALHFLFGAGAFVAPLIAEPFLSSTTSSDYNATIKFINGSNATDMTFPDAGHSFGIVVPYSLTAALFLADAASIALLVTFTKDTFKAVGEEKNKRSFKTKPNFFAFLSTMCIFTFVLCGNELTLGSLLATFAVEGSFKLSKSDGSFLTALFWGIYSAGRFLGIFVSAKVEPLHILIGDCVVVLIGCLISVISLHLSLVELLWFGMALIGLALASCFASAVIWTEKYVSITGKVASVFITGVALGEMVVPLITGQLMKFGFQDALVYVVSFNAAVNGALLIVLFFMIRYWATEDEPPSETPKEDASTEKCKEGSITKAEETNGISLREV